MRTQRVCHDTLPWLISVSLDLWLLSTFGEARWMPSLVRWNAFWKSVDCAAATQLRSCAAPGEMSCVTTRGRSVDAAAELLVGDVQRRIYRAQPLRWHETGERLTDSEAQQVINAVCRHFAR